MCLWKTYDFLSRISRMYTSCPASYKLRPGSTPRLTCLCCCERVWPEQSPAVIFKCERQRKKNSADLCLRYWLCVSLCLRVKGGPSQRGQSSSLQQKSQVNKSSYGTSPYWANWGGENLRCVFVCTCMDEQTHTRVSDWQDHRGTNHFTTQAKTHTHYHYHTLPPFALYIPFSKLWLLYVKYIYVCIYTVYMYW